MVLEDAVRLAPEKSALSSPEAGRPLVFFPSEPKPALIPVELDLNDPRIRSLPVVALAMAFAVIGK